MIEQYLKSKIVKLPMFYTKVVMVDTNDKERLFKKYGVSIEGDIYAHFFHFEDNVDWKYLIVLNTENGAGFGCLTHECFHASSYILFDKGVEPSHTNNETQAYMLQYLVNEGSVFYFNFK